MVAADAPKLGTHDTVIRAATAADGAAIARIWHRGWADGHGGRVPDELHRYRTADSYPPRVEERIGATWVAERDGAVRGFVVVIGNELEQIYVDAESRGTGLAAALLHHAESVIARSGHDRAWLAVVEGNHRARSFYERSGWHDAGPIDYEAETSEGFVVVPARRYEKRL